MPFAVNNLYSKYTIAPLKSINFGSMQFSSLKSRKVEIRNDGLFEFIYDIRKEGDEISELYTKNVEAMMLRDESKIPLSEKVDPEK